MNLLLLGRGKTGEMVEEVARERGHQMEVITSEENPAAKALTPERLKDIDVVIDFTTPDAVVLNIVAVVSAGKNMVVGTTGWNAHLERVSELVSRKETGFVHGSNFSVGVNVFFGIAQAAAAALKLGFEARIVERHHEQKKDAPSGTASSLQQVLESAGGQRPEITSIREGETVGTHVMIFDSPNDTMMLVHDAKTRRGFAEGAVRAAEWIKGRKGFYDFKDIFRQLPPDVAKKEREA
jgi:4-hydroxy-tetrahydrodipicolinate reductase